MTKASWEHFPHDADVGVRGIGATREQAFEQGAVALMAIITEPAKVAPKEMIEIRCSAPNDELLFVDWLNELIYEIATRQMLFSRFEVQIRNHELYAKAWGESTDVARHQPAVEAKGATYTALRVAQDPDGMWRAQCVVDV